MNHDSIPAASAAEIHGNGQSVAIGNSGETVEVWEYFAENIDDFATAKTIVDHFVENPKLLDNKEMDLHGLFLRAKLTLKRRAIAYAEMQSALERAREQSRGARGALKSVKGFFASFNSAIESNPTPVVLALAFSLIWLLR
jgi:hypothetical protein